MQGDVPAEVRLTDQLGRTVACAYPICDCEEAGPDGGCRKAPHCRECKQPLTGPASVLEGKYGNVLAPFVALMEAELHSNSRKGDRPGWLSMSPSTALLEIYWHTAKLSAAVKNNDAAAIREHSADVANMAMMLLDVCGGLDVLPNN
jgi:hypothetical protein